MKILTGKHLNKPYRLLLYGESGIGKSTLANTAKRPIFVDIEEGLSQIDCHRTPKIKTISQLGDVVTFLLTKKDDYDTIIIDTADALDVLITEEICRHNNKESLSAFGYGAGFDLLNRTWGKVVDGFEKLVDKGFNLVILAHPMVKKFDDPSLSDGYDKIILRLHQKPAALLMGRMDAVWYYAFETMVTGKANEKKKAVTTGSRIIHTRKKAAFDAKCRYDLPERIEVSERFNLEIFEQKIKGEK